jgi:hypothetical protein
MNTDTFLEQTTANFSRQIAALFFDGHLVTGQGGFVSIDLAKAKMFVRRQPKQKPFCYINLPTAPGAGAANAMTKALMHPKLKGKVSLEIMDDLTAVLWAYVNILLCEHPVDFRQIKLSPEAAKLLSTLSTARSS